MLVRKLEQSRLIAADKPRMLEIERLKEKNEGKVLLMRLLLDACVLFLLLTRSYAPPVQRSSATCP